MRRARGRPRGFAPEAALDCAAELFWLHGYEGTDVETVAARAGVTKPSLYRLFGDKAGLFVAALAHYGQTRGSDPIRAFLAAPNVHVAVAHFLEQGVVGATRPGGPSGCLMACVAAQCSERLPQVRAIYAASLAATENIITDRFTKAVTDAELPGCFPAMERARLLVDLMQSVALRARSGASRSDLALRVSFFARVVLA